MKMYLVMADAATEPYCIGVFSTYDKAHAHIERMNDYDPDDDNYDDNYDIEEWLVDNADLIS